MPLPNCSECHQPTDSLTQCHCWALVCGRCWRVLHSLHTPATGVSRKDFYRARAELRES